MNGHGKPLELVLPENCTFQLDLNKRLIDASKEGHLAKVKALLTEGASVNFADSEGFTGALHSVRLGNSEILREFIGKRYNLNRPDSQGRTLLHETIISGQILCFNILLKQPAINLNVQDNQGWPPLFWAINHGHEHLVQDLITKGCDVNLLDLSKNTALHEAAECGHSDICRLLTQAGCDVNVQNASGESPLLLASIEGHTKVVKLLIEIGADVDLPTETNATPLLYAAICGNLTTATILVDARANVNCCDSEGNSPVIHAAKYGHSDLVNFLIEHNCDLNHCNKSHRSLLHAAAENNHGDIIELLLKKDVDASIRDSMGKTALSLAAQLGHYQALAPLAKTNNIDVNSADLYSMTPLHWAVVGSHKECVKMLLSVGADPDIQNAGIGNTPLLLAIDCRHNEIVRILLQSQCNVNAVNNQEHSALHEAAARGATDIIDLLIPAGAYVDMQTSKGDTAIMIATRRGYKDVVQLLLDVNSNVCVRNSKYVTALHEAALWGACDVAKLLINAGSDINLSEQDGDTPLTLAAMKGHFQLVKLLLEQNCDVNRVNDMRRSALLEAAEHGHADIVKLLMEHGANVNLQDSEGDTALIMASTKGHQKVVQLLLHNGCDQSITNRWGRNALHEACSVWCGPSDTVELLLLANMCPDVQDSMMNTPLILSTLSGHGGIVRLLLKANCDVNQVGKSVGKAVKPIQIAVTKEALAISQMLYLSGCNMNSVSIWMETSGGNCFYMVPVKNQEMKDWLKVTTSNPSPLKLKCRYVVRRSLSYGVSYKIHCLPLPTQIKLYLDLCDLDDLWVAAEGRALANAITDEESSDSDSSGTETESDHYTSNSLIQSPSF